MNAPYEVAVTLTATTVAEAMATATGISEQHPRARVRIYRVLTRPIFARRVLVDDIRPNGGSR